MENQEYTITDAKQMANNLAAVFTILGQGDGADAMSILIHIIAYRMDTDEVDARRTKEYSDNLQRLTNYLNGGRPFLKLS